MLFLLRNKSYEIVIKKKIKELLLNYLRIHKRLLKTSNAHIKYNKKI